MPKTALVLHFGMQYGIPCIWALVDPDEENAIRRFRLAGTGHHLDDGIMRYIGTMQLDGGAFVLHLFEHDGD